MRAPIVSAAFPKRDNNNDTNKYNDCKSKFHLHLCVVISDQRYSMLSKYTISMLTSSIMFRKLLYPLAFVLFPFRLLAWGHAGHQMVAELAMSILSDVTRAKVERILNGMTPAEAGTWMDDIRSDPKYK